jgi:V/A-type H+-transporting ATPase subunit D
MAAFCAALLRLAELAGLETSRLRLARELKKTQRRCNALSKKLIPDCRETISFLGGALEERERESFVMLRMVRDRLRAGEPS